MSIDRFEEYVVMGAALLTAAPGQLRWLQFCGLLMMIDETWAIAMSPQAAGNRLKVIVGCGLIAMIGWIGGTMVGVNIGRHLGDIRRLGVDFVYFTVFIFILVSMARKQTEFLSWTTAAGVALLAHAALPGKWYVVVGGIAGAVVGGLSSWRKAHSF